MADDPLVLPQDEFELVRKVALCLTCLHDGVLERTLERARAAESRLAAVRNLLHSEHGSWIRMAGIWDAIGDDEEPQS